MVLNVDGQNITRYLFTPYIALLEMMNLINHRLHTSTPFWTWIVLIIHVPPSSSPAEVIKTIVSKHLSM